MPDDTLLERHCALDPAGLSAREARTFIGTLLRDAGRDEWLDAAQLAVSEVVTNVVLHAHTAFTVTARLTRDHVRVEVRDQNPTLPAQRAYDQQATTGRGMELVAAVTDAHGVQSLGAEGKVVWFCVGSPADDASADDLLDAWDDGSWDAEGGAPEAEDGGTPVVLRSMPVTLWLAARQHHDALLRELALYRATHPDGERSPDDLARADEARSLVSQAVDAAVEQAREAGTAARPLPEDHPAPLPEVPAELDLVLHVQPEQAGAFAALQDVLDSAERLAVAGQMLVRPGLPEIIAVRDWACEQVIAQLGGTDPGPWAGADHELFTRMVHDDGGASAQADWDESLVRDSDRSVIAADDANRIIAVSRSLADALGWEVEQLVGRRVVVLVPPRFREAHVAGFTRHLTTGESHVLGIELELPVLRRDGSEVVCTFLIESSGTPSGRAVYLAWITPGTGG